MHFTCAAPISSDSPFQCSWPHMAAATVLNTLGTDDRSCPVWSYLQVLHSMSTFYWVHIFCPILLILSFAAGGLGQRWFAGVVGVGHSWASLVAQRVKNPPEIHETWVRSLGQEDPLEEGMATHSSTLAWRTPWTEEPSRLQSVGSQRVGQNWVTKHGMSQFLMHLLFMALVVKSWKYACLFLPTLKSCILNWM